MPLWNSFPPFTRQLRFMIDIIQWKKAVHAFLWKGFKWVVFILNWIDGKFGRKEIVVRTVILLSHFDSDSDCDFGYDYLSDSESDSDSDSSNNFDSDSGYISDIYSKEIGS